MRRARRHRERQIDALDAFFQRPDFVITNFWVAALPADDLFAGDVTLTAIDWVFIHFSTFFCVRFLSPPRVALTKKAATWLAVRRFFIRTSTATGKELQEFFFQIHR